MNQQELRSRLFTTRREEDGVWIAVLPEMFLMSGIGKTQEEAIQHWFFCFQCLTAVMQHRKSLSQTILSGNMEVKE